eukprot:scaffold3504_cov240-Pinguiococcus_pyrenoidosus.AAC.45
MILLLQSESLGAELPRIDLSLLRLVPRRVDSTFQLIQRPPGFAQICLQATADLSQLRLLGLGVL